MMSDDYRHEYQSPSILSTKAPTYQPPTITSKPLSEEMRARVMRPRMTTEEFNEVLKNAYSTPLQPPRYYLTSWLKKDLVSWLKKEEE